MAAWIRIHDHTVGKKTVRGEPNPNLRTYETVVAISRSGIDKIIGARSMGERVRILRRMRDDGLLVTGGGKGRLTMNVRGGSPPLPADPLRAYVFDCEHPDYVAVAADRIRRPHRYRH